MRNFCACADQMYSNLGLFWNRHLPRVSLIYYNTFHHTQLKPRKLKLQTSFQNKRKHNPLRHQNQIFQISALKQILLGFETISN